MDGMTISGLVCIGTMVVGVIGLLVFFVAGTARRKTPHGGWASSDAPRTPQKINPFVWVGILVILCAGYVALLGLIPGIQEVLVSLGF